MGIMGVVGNAKTGNAASGLGRYDAKRKNNWVMEFTGLGSNTLKNSLLVQLQKSARPTLNITEKEIRFANERWYVGATPSFETLEVTFYDALPSSGVDYQYNRAGVTSPHPDGNTSMVSAGQIMWDWYLLMYDPTSGRIGLEAITKSPHSSHFTTLGTHRLKSGCILACSQPKSLTATWIIQVTVIL